MKRISSILEEAKSSYIGPFQKLSGQIKVWIETSLTGNPEKDGSCTNNVVLQEGSYQAQSNLKFLTVLKDPCVELAEAEPKNIGPKLQKILNLIRMIWVNSEFYKTRERLTGILRKVCKIFCEASRLLLL